MNKRLLSTIALTLSIAVSQVLPTFANANCDPSLDYLTLAREQYDAGEFAASFDSYTCFLTADSLSDSQSVAAYMGRGNAARNLGQYQQAISDYDQVIALHQYLPIAYNNRGWAYYNLGDYAHALSSYNLAIQVNPNFAYAYNNRGLVYLMQGNNALAAADFNRAIELNIDPISWPQYNLQMMGQTASAPANAVEPMPVEPSTPTNPTNPAAPSVDTLMMTATSAWRDEQWEQTIEHATAVLELDPQNANAYVYRADGHYSLDHFEEALADFNQAIALSPDNAYAIGGRAYTLAYLGDFENAYADYERILDLQPGHVNNHLVLGTIEVAQGNDAAAGAEFLAALEMLERGRRELATVAIGDRFTVEMTAGLVYAIPFEAEAGQIVSFDSHSDLVDPLMVVLDPNGQPIAGDDDSCSKLDAMMFDIPLEATGTYTLLVGHAGGGTEGIIELALIAEDAPASEMS